MLYFVVDTQKYLSKVMWYLHKVMFANSHREINAFNAHHYEYTCNICYVFTNEILIDSHELGGIMPSMSFACYWLNTLIDIIQVISWTHSITSTNCPSDRYNCHARSAISSLLTWSQLLLDQVSNMETWQYICVSREKAANSKGWSPPNSTWI